mmetsp:Transcript_427/g.1194  ORF Transcript_427/g.1194 Transcript_427/m.1194 type:complete len:284 (+) Transcript_427:848-1699(+)
MRASRPAALGEADFAGDASRVGVGDASRDCGDDRRCSRDVLPTARMPDREPTALEVEPVPAGVVAVASRFSRFRCDGDLGCDRCTPRCVWLVEAGEVAAKLRRGGADGAVPAPPESTAAGLTEAGEVRLLMAWLPSACAGGRTPPTSSVVLAPRLPEHPLELLAEPRPPNTADGSRPSSGVSWTSTAAWETTAASISRRRLIASDLAPSMPKSAGGKSSGCSGLPSAAVAPGIGCAIQQCRLLSQTTPSHGLLKTPHVSVIGKGVSRDLVLGSAIASRQLRGG